MEKSTVSSVDNELEPSYILPPNFEACLAELVRLGASLQKCSSQAAESRFIDLIAMIKAELRTYVKPTQDAWRKRFKDKSKGGNDVLFVGPEAKGFYLSIQRTPEGEIGCFTDSSKGESDFGWSLARVEPRIKTLKRWARIDSGGNAYTYSSLDHLEQQKAPGDIVVELSGTYEEPIE